jgi:hypothetical protein
MIRSPIDSGMADLLVSLHLSATAAGEVADTPSRGIPRAKVAPDLASSGNVGCGGLSDDDVGWAETPTGRDCTVKISTSA